MVHATASRVLTSASTPSNLAIDSSFDDEHRLVIREDVSSIQALPEREPRLFLQRFFGIALTGEPGQQTKSLFGGEGLLPNGGNLM